MEEKRESRTCEEDGPGLHWHTTLFSTGGCSWPSYPGSPREGGGPCRVWGAHGFGTTGLTYLFDLRVPGPHPEEGLEFCSGMTNTKPSFRPGIFHANDPRAYSEREGVRVGSGGPVDIRQQDFPHP